MTVLLFCQYYRTADPQRQLELDACLRANLHHPAIDRAVLYLEPDAPELPSARCSVEVVPLERRLTYSDWLQRLQQEEDGVIGLLINADIELGQGIERLDEVLANKSDCLALSRYTLQGSSSIPSLNDYPHWTQDAWALRADASITPSLLHASTFPLGFVGCDNRIAHVLWSHGFVIKNPCYHLCTIHRHHQFSRSYDKSKDRLYGAGSFVHPSLSISEPSLLEHILWSHGAEPIPGLQVHLQAEGSSPYPLIADGEVLQDVFQKHQQFLSLSWDHHCLGSSQIPPFGGEESATTQLSEDALFLPMSRLLADGVSLVFPGGNHILGASLRLPRLSSESYCLDLKLEAGSASMAGARESREIAGRGQRNLLSSELFLNQPLQSLHVRLSTSQDQPQWQSDDGAELVLFVPSASGSEAKTLKQIAEDEHVVDAREVVRSGSAQLYQWLHRSQLVEQLDKMEVVVRFGSRFIVRRDGQALLFEDRFWPLIGRLQLADLETSDLAGKDLFLLGFCQPTLTLNPPLSRNPLSLGPEWPVVDGLPSIETEAYLQHLGLDAPQFSDDLLRLYVAVPWSHQIEKHKISRILLRSVKSRLESLGEQLRDFGIELDAHTVCSHQDWRDHLDTFRQLGIHRLGIPHLQEQLDGDNGICLYPWIGASQAETKAMPFPHAQIAEARVRPFLLSFLDDLPPGDGTGLDNKSLQEGLLKLRDCHRVLIDLDGEIISPLPLTSSQQNTHNEPGLEAEDVNLKAQEELQRRRGRVLCDSEFVLCLPPEHELGISIHQCIAAGAIPVLVIQTHPGVVEQSYSDAIAALQQDWGESLLLHPVENLANLLERLEAMPLAERQRCRDAGLRFLDLDSCPSVVDERVEQGHQSERLLSEDPRPLIIIPEYGSRDRYFWRHRKCAFYDIVIEWYLRGYVRIGFGESGYFWWGDVGQVLLFERDLIVNLEDGKKDPPRWPWYVPYQYAFFANQYHLESSRNFKLTYWGYAPMRLERVRRQRGRVPWDGRRHGSFFAGSIENETQEYFRHQFDGWETCIEIFACADKLNKGESNFYDQDQYLELVAHSRFGVCFHGNGPKCYREIECLALGTPLIITEGVEVDYPEPLQEGIHFFRADCREDIPAIISRITEEHWNLMSLACWEWFERNAQIDALFSSLDAQISRLDLEAVRHDRVCILAEPQVGVSSLAARSLRVMDPHVHIEYGLSPNPDVLQIGPDELIINELPFRGMEDAYPWRCAGGDLFEYLKLVLDSPHPQHKSLCAVMGVRLRNFKVVIQGRYGDIALASRLIDGKLRLMDESEIAFLESDFDWARRCGMKYPALTRVIKGPAVIEQEEITAFVVYQREGSSFQADLSDELSDFYAVSGCLVPGESIAAVCHFWKFQNCVIESVYGELRLGSRRQRFEYLRDLATGFRLTTYDLDPISFDSLESSDCPASVLPGSGRDFLGRDTRLTGGNC